MRKMITQRIRLCSDTDCRGHNGSDGRPYARKGHMPEKATQWLSAATILKVIGLEAILKEVSCNESPFLSYITRRKHSDLLVLQEKMVHTYDHHFVGFWLMYMLPAKIKRGYGEFGRVASVSSAVPALAFCFFYLPGTAMVSGMTGTAGLGRSVAFEPNRNLITAVSNHVNPVLISAYDYANDAAGRRVSRNADSFTFNSRSEVIGAVIGTNDYGYAYDAIGNRVWSAANNLTNTYAANRLNLYTAVTPSVAVAYDADGNMTRLGDWRHTWDAENRLVQSQPYGLATNGAIRLKYQYNHRNLRIAKITERLSGRGASYPFDPSQPGTWDAVETRRYVWDGYNIAAEIVIDEVTPSTNVTYYTWGLDLSGTLQGAGGVGGLLAVTTADLAQPDSLTTYYPCYDANGNITEYVDGSGTVRAHYEYSPFGEIVAQSGDMADTFTHRFSTKPFDVETGLVMYQLRPYAPSLGRWMSRDKFGEFGGIGLLAMLRNDSVNDVDYLGLISMYDWGRPLMPSRPRQDPYGPHSPPTIGPADPYRATRRADRPDTPFMPWYKFLPDCPPTIPLDKCGRPKPMGNGWSKPAPANSLHSGATWEIRWNSGRLFGSGQQCTYDEDGKLITAPPAAGTPDLFGFDPSLGMLHPHNLPHAIFDALPFLLLKRVNPNLYFIFWPPNQGR
jgi:RHS repeat-associated protein